MNGEVVAFVHAKGQSSRVPGKNLRRLGDRPLFCHAIRNAREAKLVSRVIIDSDDDEILAIGAQHGAEPRKRPAALASNGTTGDDLAYYQARTVPESRVVLQVIPTAPFLSPVSIDGAIELMLRRELDSVAGVFADVFYCWQNDRPSYYRADGTIPNSNELTPILFETTGLYVNRTASVLTTHRRMNPERAAGYLLSRLEAIDINTPEDFEFAELVWLGLQQRRSLSGARGEPGA
jgi:CMP-N-acetylneuraminic acid synthetase